MVKVPYKKVIYGDFLCDIPVPEQRPYFTIYKLTNLINGKWYVGQHKTKKLNDGYPSSSDVVRNALIKHGPENFRYEILFFAADQDELNRKEAELVTLEQVRDSQCYNLQAGGLNSEKTVEHRARIAASVTSSLGATPKKPIIRGRFGWERNQGMANPQADRALRRFKKGDCVVVCTQSELRLAHGLDHATLGRLMRGERKTHKGWEYLGLASDENKYTGP